MDRDTIGMDKMPKIREKNAKKKEILNRLKERPTIPPKNRKKRKKLLKS